MRESDQYEINNEEITTRSNADSGNSNKNNINNDTGSSNSGNKPNQSNTGSNNSGNKPNQSNTGSNNSGINNINIDANSSYSDDDDSIYIPRKNKKKSPEEEREESNKNFLTKLNRSVPSYDDPFANLINIYGPNGKIPKKCSDNENEKSKYDELTIDVPEDLDENIVTAIVLGACLSSPRLKGGLTSSSNYDPTDKESTGMNSNYLIENITKGDSRSQLFVPIMTEARKEAIKAINEYKNNNKTMVYKYLNAFVDHAESQAYDNIAMLVNDPQELSESQKFHFFVKEIENNTKIKGFRRNLKGYEKASRAVYHSYLNQLASVRDSVKIKKSLIDDDSFFNLSKEEKENKIFNVLMLEYVAVTGQVRDNNCQKKGLDLLEKSYKQLGVDKNFQITENNIPKPIGALLKRDMNILETSISYKKSFLKYTVDDLTAILAKPDGIDTLKNLYGEKIRNSSTFKKLVASKNRAELIDNIHHIDPVGHNGFEQFKDVILPDESETFNTNCQIILNNVNKKISDNVQEKILNRFYKDELEANKIKSFDENGLKENAAFIKKMLEDINAVDKYTSSPNFKAMKESLRELSTLATELSAIKGNIRIEDINTYNNKIKEVSDLALTYLDNKTNINSNYAKKRVLAVGKLRRNLIEHTSTLEAEKKNQMDKYADMAKKYENNTFKKYQSNTIENKKIFWGTYKTKDFQGIEYNISRSSGVSIATFALICEGYSFHEVTDPALIKDEKQKMFDKVIKKIKSNTPEDRKWLANVIFTGFKKYDEMINEQVKYLDFKDPKLTKTELFAKMSSLSYLAFDVWQEMHNLKAEITSLAHKDNPNINDYEDYKNYRYDRRGIFAFLNSYNDKILESLPSAANEEKASSNTYNKLISSSIGMQLLLQLGDKLKNNKDKSFTELMADYHSTTLKPIFDYVNEHVSDFSEIFKEDPESTRAVMRKITDSTLFKDIKIGAGDNPGEFEIINLPDAAKLKEEAGIERFMDRAILANNKLANRNPEKYNQEKYLRDVSFVAVGKLYYIIKELPVDPATQKTISLEKVRKELLNSDILKDTFKNPDDPTKFISPKDAFKKMGSTSVINKLLGKYI
nr:hypothetical protein [Lachnospiraceae bacterium]